VRTSAPTLSRLSFRAPSIFGDGDRGLITIPAKHPPLVNGVKRVDEHDRPRERQPSRDCPAAEPFDKRCLSAALEADARDPACERGELLLGHSRPYDIRDFLNKWTGEEFP
jgi:hypothetical protein